MRYGERLFGFDVLPLHNALAEERLGIASSSPVLPCESKKGGLLAMTIFGHRFLRHFDEAQYRQAQDDVTLIKLIF